MPGSGWNRTDVPAPVPGAAPVFQGTVGLAAAVGLRPERLIACDLDRHPVAERVDDRYAHPVQPAGRLVDLAAEFATRVKRGEHDLRCADLSENLGMRVDRDTSPVVADCDRAVGFERQVDPGRVARHDLVHRVVEHLGGEMVQRDLVGAADIHAGTAAHRFEAFENLDVLGRVTPGSRRGFGGCARHRT